MDTRLEEARLENRCEGAGQERRPVAGAGRGAGAAPGGMALGARPLHVLKLIFAQSLGMLLIGIVIGLAGAFALTRLMRTLLFEITATDPLTYVSVIGLLAVVALLACYIPARRAAKVDPLIALRYE